MRRKFAVPIFLIGIGIFSMVMLLMAYPNISNLYIGGKLLPTSVFGDKYGMLSGYMQDVENQPCGSGCYNRYIRAFATTSRSNPTPQVPIYHEKVRVEHRVLDPYDPYNQCKEIRESYCPVNIFKACNFSGDRDFSKSYWFTDPNTYYIAKNTANYDATVKTRLFTRWPFTINGNEAVLTNSYWFRGKRTTDQPKICAGKDFTPFYEEDRENDDD